MLWQGCIAMSKTVTLSDAIYDRLSRAAAEHGLPNIEALLIEWMESSGAATRRETITRIRILHGEMAAKYGPQPDSTDLIREDRSR
jgi:hypothetical protein